jgi:hypothetical protein
MAVNRMSSTPRAEEASGAGGRAAAALLGGAGALLVGGVAQAVVWRWGVDWLTAVTNSQFLWVLLCFCVAWGWSRGSLGRGATAGGLTGLALIASYYLVQWAVEGPHAALSQLTHSRGLAWTAASVIGGCGVGLLGALAGEPAVRRPARKAFGLIGAGTLVGGGPAVWLLASGDRLLVGQRAVAVAVFVTVGLVLVATAVRRCGPRAAFRGGVSGACLALLLLVVLFLLEEAGILYLTF